MKKFEFRRRITPAITADFILTDTIYKFCEEKRLQKRSPRTVQTYQHTLRHFAKYCAENEYRGIEDDCVRDYVRYMTFEKTKWDDHPTNHSDVVGVSARSVNNAVRILRVFYNWAVKNRHIAESPAANVGLQKEDEDTFEVFTDVEIEAMLASPNRRTYTGFRDYVMMVLIIDTGLRVGEMSSLIVSDFDFNYRQIHIRAEITKARKSRVVPISKTTTELLRELFDMTGVDLDTIEEEQYVFLSQFGDRFHGDTFAKMLKQYAKRANIPIKARVSPHTFRHYFAVKFLRNGGDTFALMKILGHKDLSMTQRYVRYVESDLQESHDKASPIESLIAPKRKSRGPVRFR